MSWAAWADEVASARSAVDEEGPAKELDSMCEEQLAEPNGGEEGRADGAFVGPKFGEEPNVVADSLRLPALEGAVPTPAEPELMDGDRLMRKVWGSSAEVSMVGMLYNGNGACHDVGDPGRWDDRCKLSSKQD